MDLDEAYYAFKNRTVVYLDGKECLITSVFRNHDGDEMVTVRGDVVGGCRASAGALSFDAPWGITLAEAEQALVDGASFVVKGGSTHVAKSLDYDTVMKRWRIGAAWGGGTLSVALDNVRLA